MQFLIDHYDEILALLGTAYALVCGVVALTPTQSDDDALRRFQQRISFFQPRNVPGILKMPGRRPGAPEDPRGTAALVVLLCIAPLLGACGGKGVEVARHAAAGGALAVVAADPILAAEYDRVTAGLDAGTMSEDAAVERLRKLDRAERALRSLSSSLTAVDLALGAYEDGRECGLRPALDGAAAATAELLDAFSEAGLDVPPMVSQVLSIASVFVDAPVCVEEVPS